MTRTRATLIGFCAVLLWSLLALLGVGAGAVPPFLLTALTFAIGGLLGLADIARRGAPLGRALILPARLWLLGVGGLFAYHALYFTAIQAAPPAEASLIAYLWPLFIVLGSGLLPGGRLGLWHLVGALLGLGGAALLLLGGQGFAVEPAHLAGLAAAFGCAVIWMGYSLLSRLAGEAPTDSVAGFCLGVAALSALAHLALEPTVWPQGVWAWGSVLALGLGPVGAAFYAWDVGCKHGDIQLLGATAYAAPLISTLLLVAAGVAAPSERLGLAALMITAGAGLAAWGSARARSAAKL